jgi:hypothetical protein
MPLELAKRPKGEVVCEIGMLENGNEREPSRIGLLV